MSGTRAASPEPAPSADPLLSWPVPDAWPAFEDDTVHVWGAALDVPPSSADALASVLRPEERARAAGFRFERDRLRFVAARGTLRHLLGRCLGVPPDRLTLVTGPHGKPRLGGQEAASRLRFNLAHSDGLALYAVARGREVGIDIEQVHPGRADLDVAERFFAPAEVAVLRRLEGCDRVAAFFRCWTRKEAYVKARGEGLGRLLKQFEVSVAPGEPAALRATQDDPAEAVRWSLRDLAPAPGYAAAIAVEGQDWRVACWRWAQAPVPRPEHRTSR